MENKHLDWINIGTDLESDTDALERFSLWIEKPYTPATVALTVREGWELIDKEDPLVH